MDFIETSTVEPGHLDSELKKEIQKIPDRLSFKIGEAADLLKVKTHVLRYWEAEFALFHPKKLSNGQRIYLRKDVETALLIKKLLYRDGFSVKGAKKALKTLKMENRIHRHENDRNIRLRKKLDLLLKKISDLREVIK